MTEHWLDDGSQHTSYSLQAKAMYTGVNLAAHLKECLYDFASSSNVMTCIYDNAQCGGSRWPVCRTDRLWVFFCYFAVPVDLIQDTALLMADLFNIHVWQIYDGNMLPVNQPNCWKG